MRSRHLALMVCTARLASPAAAVRFAAEDSMPRQILEEARIHPAVRERIAQSHADTVRAVQALVQEHAVVVVGMASNPFPRKARKLLDAAGVPYHYISYGSYFSDWRRRNALKMWTGWPTLPMVFVKGQLVGGADDLAKLIDSGELRRPLA
jgi:glutaredoxin-related protein